MQFILILEQLLTFILHLKRLKPICSFYIMKWNLLTQGNFRLNEGLLNSFCYGVLVKV